MTQSPLVNQLCSAITPSDRPVKPIAVDYTAPTVALAIQKTFTTKGQINDEIQQLIEQDLTVSFFTHSTVFGIPKESIGLDEVYQLASSSATMVVYDKFLIYCLNITEGALNELMSHIELSFQDPNEISIISQIIPYLSQYSQLMFYMATIIDHEYQSIPKQCQINNPAKLFEAVCQDTTAITPSINKVLTSKTPESYEALKQAVSDILQKIQELRNLLVESIHAIKSNFDPLYTEPSFAAFQKFLLEFAQNAVNVTIISMLASISNIEQFILVVQVLRHFTEASWKICAFFTHLMRFRGSMEKILKSTEEAKETVNQILQPLLMALVKAIETTPDFFHQIAGDFLVSQFRGIQQFVSEYDTKVDEMLAAFQRDKRILSMSGMRGVSPSDLVKKTIPAIKVLLALIEKLVTTDATQQSLFTDIQDLNKSFISFVNDTKEDLPEGLSHEIQVEMIGFITSFKALSPTSISRIETAQKASNLLLTLCEVDYDDQTVQAIEKYRQCCAYIIIQIIVTNLTYIMTLIDEMKQDSANLDETTKAFFQYYCNLFTQELRRVHPILLDNTDPSKPESVIACMHVSDSIAAYLDVISSQCQDKEQVYQFTALLKEASSNVRISIQQNYYQLLVIEFDLIQSLFRSLKSASQLNTNQQFLQFVAKADQLNQIIDLLRSKCINHAPSGCFDFNSIKEIQETANFVSAVAMQMLEVGQEYIISPASPDYLKVVSKKLIEILNKTGELKSLIEELGPTEINEDIRGHLIQHGIQEFTKALQMFLQNPEAFDDVARAGYNLAQILDSCGADGSHIRSSIQLMINDRNDQEALQQMVIGLNETKEVTIKLIAEASQKAAEMTVETEQVEDPNFVNLKDEKGQAIPGLEVEKMPSIKQLDDLFMQAMQSDKPVVSNFVAALITSMKDSTNSALTALEEYNKEPSPEIVQRINDLGKAQNIALAAISETATFDPSLANLQTLSQLFPAYQQASDEDKIKLALKIAIIENGVINELYNDPVRSSLSSRLTKQFESFPVDPYQALLTIHAMGVLLTQDAHAALIHNLSELKNAKDTPREKELTAINNELIDIINTKESTSIPRVDAASADQVVQNLAISALNSQATDTEAITDFAKQSEDPVVRQRVKKQVYSSIDKALSEVPKEASLDAALNVCNLLTSMDDIDTITPEQVEPVLSNVNKIETLQVNTEEANNLASASLELVKAINQLSKISTETIPELFEAQLKLVKETLTQSLQKFKEAAISASSSTNEAENIQNLLQTIEQIESAQRLPSSQAKDFITQIGVVLDRTLHAKSLFAVDTEALEKLPLRFVPVEAEIDQEGTHETYFKQSTTSIQELESTVSTLLDSLNGTDILDSLKAYHTTLSSVVQTLKLYISSLWLPNSKEELHRQLDSITQTGDDAIALARQRLSLDKDWSQNAEQFKLNTLQIIKNTLKSIDEANTKAEEDLKTTNETDKTLMETARNIADSQRQLERIERKSDLTSEIVDTASPIFELISKLIEAARAQTKYCLENQPELTNKAGLNNSAVQLGQSLELLLISSKELAKDPNQIEKVIAACNLISGSIARFTAESNQKEGLEELNEYMKGITDHIYKTIKNLKSRCEELIPKKETKGPTGGKVMNKMVMRINAETKVSKARKDLEMAEAALKKERQLNAKGASNQINLLNAEAAVVQKKRLFEEAKEEMEALTK